MASLPRLFSQGCRPWGNGGIYGVHTINFEILEIKNSGNFEFWK